MTSLPPIRGSVSKGDVGHSTTTNPSDVKPTFHARPHSAAAVPPSRAPVEEGINRNELRQEANWRVQHITCGVAERQSFLEVLRHIGDRFAHTSHEPLRPLVLPPQLPSIARPREPQTARFSRGVAQYKAAAVRASSAAGAQPPSAAGLAAAPDAGDHARRVAADADSVTAGSDASTGFTAAHRWEMLDLGDRAFFHRTMEEASAASGTGTPLTSAAANLVLFDFAAPSPLDALPTFEEKFAYLAELEVAERQYVMACATWDQQIISEMMAVHYVTFVLKPCMDVLRKEELEGRENIAQHEDRLSFFMYNESPLAVAVKEGRRAMLARELQLERILNVSPAPPAEPPQPSASSDPLAIAASRAASAAPPAAGDASTPTPPAESADTTPAAAAHPPAVESLAATPSAQASERTPSVSPPHSSSVGSAQAPSPVAPVPAAGAGVSSDEARRLLTQYVRRRHGASLNAVGTCATTAQEERAWRQGANATYAGGHDTVRRSSALVLPPVAGAQAPRRNAVGIADYVALLDESTKHREQIVHAEERCRADMNQACYEEMQVVLEWQRRRMHLERLVYWRHQRESVVRKEVAALTVVTPPLQLNPRVLLLMEMLEGEEEEARLAVVREEDDGFYPIWEAGEQVLGVYGSAALQQHCLDTLNAEVYTAEGVQRRELLAAAEAEERQHTETSTLAQLTAELRHGMALLRRLYEASIDPAQCAALLTLQQAFRRSLRGRLGWRHANQELGRAIADMRNAQRINSGTKAMHAFRAALTAELAGLCKEQARQHHREQRSLMNDEASDRTAVCAEQEWVRKAMARARVQHVEEVYQPWLVQCTADAHETRLEVEVEEELEREAMCASRAALCTVIAHKGAVQHEERAGRKAVVKEERAAWQQLLGAEGDCREEIRIDDIARTAALEEVRQALADEAQAELQELHQYALTVHVARMSEAMAELMCHAVRDDAERRGIEREEAAEARALLDGAAVTQCTAWATALSRQRQAELHHVHRQVIYINETEHRAALLHEEAAEWTRTEPELLGLLSGPLRDLILRRRAAGVISEWYLALRAGDVGRAVSRQRLRSQLARHREEHQLRARQVAQRLHTQQVRSQLDALMGEMHAERQEAVQQLLDIVVRREEPRGREHVESLQEVIFGVLQRNAEAHLGEVRSGLVNSEALIWQQELYERKLLTKAWRRAFAELLDRERQQLSEDFFAARIQRAWRGYAAQLHTEQMLARQRSQVLALEQQGRAAVALSELEEAVTQIIQPCLSTSYMDAYVRQFLARAHEERSLAVMRATRADEWADRVALLWEMRYEDCDVCLCEEEARARRALEAEFHKPFLLQTEMREEEWVQRKLLMRERALFLLRILAREEYEDRLTLSGSEAQRRSQLQTQLATLAPAPAPVPATASTPEAEEEL